MNVVRTTISLPIDIYETLRLQAFTRRVSFGEIITERIRATKTDVSIGRIRKDLAFFDRVARSGQRINMNQALREERNRQNE